MERTQRLWRDALAGGLRYYGRLGKLAIRGVEAVAPAVAGLGVRLRPDAARTPEPAGGQKAKGRVLRSAERTIVIEAEAGRRGLGVFLVENGTSRGVSAPVQVSPFRDPSGREVSPPVRFRPDPVMLEPGEQVLVQVAAAIDETLEPGARYRAEISIPGLSGMRVPIVLRRRPGEPPGTGAKSAARGSGKSVDGSRTGAAATSEARGRAKSRTPGRAKAVDRSGAGAAATSAAKPETKPKTKPTARR